MEPAFHRLFSVYAIMSVEGLLLGAAMDSLITPLFASVATILFAGMVRAVLHDVWGIGTAPDIRFGDDVPDNLEPSTRRQRLTFGYPVMVFVIIAIYMIAWTERAAFMKAWIG
jgi:hypothetical protein